tara:strand:- start:2121 stop:3179 length:1059 start_codon:yes stop_codon:yes gene_type:complete
MIIFYVGIYIASKVSFKSFTPFLYTSNYRIENQNSYNNKLIYKFLLTLISLIIFISYLNLIITGEPPLFSSNYIDRHTYLDSTRLWFILKYFGKVQTYIPIILGYYLLNRRHQGSLLKIILLFISYFFYLIIIGNKFGALQSSLFLFLFPLYITKILNSEKILTFRMIMMVFGILISIFCLIAYHFLMLGEASRGMGVVEFIFYRIFALQGHVFWGAINYMNDINLSISNLWDGMVNLMKLLSGPGIGSEIDRGVRFSGGFPAILFISVPLFVNYLLYIFFIIIYFTLFKKMINNLHNLSYLIYSNIVIGYNYFIGMGTLSALFGPKMIFLFLALLFYLLLEKVSEKVNIIR